MDKVWYRYIEPRNTPTSHALLELVGGAGRNIVELVYVIVLRQVKESAVQLPPP